MIKNYQISDITPNIPSSLIENEELKTKGRILDYIQLSNEYIDVISQILHEIINENAALVNKREEENSIIKGFISKKHPHITSKNYLKRLMK